MASSLFSCHSGRVISMSRSWSCYPNQASAYIYLSDMLVGSYRWEVKFQCVRRKECDVFEVHLDLFLATLFLLSFSSTFVLQTYWELSYFFIWIRWLIQGYLNFHSLTPKIKKWSVFRKILTPTRSWSSSCNHLQF